MKKILLAVLAFSFFAGVSQAFELPKRNDEPPHKICPAGYYYDGRMCVRIPIRPQQQ